MGIDVVWDTEEKQVIRLDFSCTWSWADCDKATSQATRMLENTDCSFAVIHNLPHETRMPQGQPFLHLRQMGRSLARRSSIIAIAGENSALKSVLSMFFRAFGDPEVKIVLAASLDEARAEIARDRQGASQAL